MAKEREYFFEYKMGFMMTISAIVTIVALAVPILLMYLWFDDTGFYDFVIGKTTTLIIGFVIMFLWMVLHEILHGTFYILGGANKKNITYGAALEKGIFYCRCGEYVNKKTIMRSLMAPFTIIGVITLIIGFLTKQWWLVVLSGMNIGGAGADLCMFFFFLKRKDDIKFREYGDSSIFSLKTTEHLDNKKFKCVKLIDEEKVPKNDNKVRLVISKASWGFLILMVILFCLCFLLEKLA
ncbi:MAG: DUF3267 domain-containing protein [Bacilli bacterium]|nr:DUF3267 domain-containing protein [Bacilli bacterium]